MKVSRDDHIMVMVGFKILPLCLFFSICRQIYWLLSFCFTETWRKFKAEVGNVNKDHQTLCEPGVREMATFLNPKQMEGLCSP